MKRIAGFGFGLLLVASPASAGMIGFSIEATALFPDLVAPTTIGGPVVSVVGPGIEFLDGQFLPFFGPSFDFADTTITITTTSVFHSAATFNGYRFTDFFSVMPAITGVSILGDGSGFFTADPSRIFFDGNNIWINFQGLSFSGSETIVLGVQQVDAVPEPATLLLLGTGLAAAAARRRLTKRT